MKFKFIALSALAAAVAFVSCNQDNTDVLPANAQKSVSITILNQSQTRAAGTELTPGSVHGTNVIDAKTLYVVFADGNDHILAITGQPATLGDVIQENFEAGTGENVGKDTYKFHRLPRAVEKIALTNLPVGSYTTLAALKASQAIDETLGLDEFPIWGDDELEFADANHQHTVTDPDSGEQITEYTDLYTAHIEVNPLWARFEIYGIQCDDLGSTNARFSALTLGTIGLVYENETLATVGENFKDAILPAGTVLDDAGDIYQITIPGENEEPGVPETGVFAFNVTDTAVPSIHLSIPGATRKLNGGTVENLFVKTTTLSANNELITAIEPGSIYQILYKFKDENVKTEGENPTLICVDVIVTVKKWDVKTTVTPVFE